MGGGRGRGGDGGGCKGVVVGAAESETVGVAVGGDDRGGVGVGAVWRVFAGWMGEGDKVEGEGEGRVGDHTAHRKQRRAVYGVLTGEALVSCWPLFLWRNVSMAAWCCHRTLLPWRWPMEIDPFPCVHSYFIAESNDFLNLLLSYLSVLCCAVIDLRYLIFDRSRFESNAPTEK